MAVCRVCGGRVGKDTDAVLVGGQALHAGCVESHKEPKKRRIGMWAAMGSRGQMAMGDVQRDTPTD
jgi:hypothetical protein